MVGFCIHLGGYYSHEWREKLEKSNIELPIMGVSLLSSDDGLSSIGTNGLYNLMWGAGWWTDRQKIEGTKLAYGEETIGKQTVKEITFFLDLLALNDSDTGPSGK
jgi:hypothetical protein